MMPSRRWVTFRVITVSGGIDLNASFADFDIVNALIAGDVRAPYLGFDSTDAIVLQSRGH